MTTCHGQVTGLQGDPQDMKALALEPNPYLHYMGDLSDLQYRRAGFLEPDISSGRYQTSNLVLISASYPYMAGKVINVRKSQLQ